LFVDPPPCLCLHLTICSGGHVNPATTLAAFLIGRITLVKGIMYVLAQMLGATLGAAFLGVWLKSAQLSQLICP
jgi:glycerol uptake facilitator-like aquaporin